MGTKRRVNVRRHLAVVVLAAVVTTAMAVMGPARALAPAPVLAPYLSYDIGGALAVATGEFTGDGRNDVLVTTVASSRVGAPARLYLFAQGADGWLNRVNSFDIDVRDRNEGGIGVGDLDGDGLVDAVVATAPGLQVFFRRAGGLTVGPLLPATGYHQVEVADVDGDGRADLVASGRAGMALLRGTGAGAFGAPAIVGTEWPAEVQIGDLTADGRPDLVSCESGIVALYPQLVGGGFGSPTRHGGDTNCEAMALADVNGDGRADISFVGGWQPPDSRLDVLLQQAGGGLPERATSYRAGFGPNAVKAGDMNGDGRTDLVVLHGGWRSVGVQAQAPDHTLDPERGFPLPLANEGNPKSLAVGDVNGDSRPDVVVADDTHGLLVLWGQAAGPSTTTSSVKLPTTVTTAPPTGSAPAVFTPAQPYDLKAWGSSVATGDFNGDGRTDVALSTKRKELVTANYKLFVFYQSADGSLQRAVSFDTEGDVGFASDVMALATGDLDGDGLTDLVLRMRDGIDVFMQRGGTFADRKYVELPHAGRVDIADLDGDGKGDLVFSGFGISVHRSLGSGTFAPAETVVAGGSFDEMAIGDMTGDGRLDLVTTDWVLPGFVLVHPQQADGHFGAPVRTSAGGSPGPLVLGDFSGDGRLDVAVAHSGADYGYKAQLRILTQTPDGKLVSAGDTIIANASSNNAPMRAADVDGDGRTDLVTVTGGGGAKGVGVRLQGVDGRLGPERIYPFLGSAPYVGDGVALADFTGDGRPDLAAANFSYGMDVLRNFSGAQPDPDTDRFHSMDPRRILDTRSGVGAPARGVGPGGTVALQIAGAAGISGTGVSAVALNITVTEPSTGGFLTAWPSGTSRPLASNLNFGPGETVANLVVVKVGADGKVNLFNSAGSAHFVADVAGWYGPGSASPGAPYHPVGPTRILDTRSSTGVQPPTMEPSSILTIGVPGRAGVPAGGTSAVVLNVTVTNPTAVGFLTAWGSFGPQPLASNMNFAPGQTVANLVVVKVQENGQVYLFNSAGRTDVVIDVAGWYGLDALGVPGSYTGLEPARLLDTRIALGAPAAKIGPGGAIELQVTGRGGVPASGVGAVVLNVTVTEPTTGSFLTAWPAGMTRPLASNLNFRAGQTVANLVMVNVGAGGKVALYSHSGSAHVIVDVAGWYTM